MQKTATETSAGFRNLNINPKLLDAITAMGYETPTPIQEQAIPILNEGKDLFGVAQTGTGKTLAFAIPLIQQIGRVKGIGLVMVPTRELALQVHETFEKIGRKIGLRTAVVIGGADMHRQIRALKDFPHVIIGTPGRIIDHLTRRTMKLDSVSVLVLDEADLMLDMGFAPQIKRILETVPTKRQTMLFSATLPPGIQKIANDHMVNPVRIEVSPAGTASETVTQKVRYLKPENKLEALDSLLAENAGSALVFVRTKHAAKKLTGVLKDKNTNAVEIHSNRSLAQRRAALDGFKRGKHRVLVATDIAARGIDVSSVGMVINFDMPEKAEDYVHRIGRTGRAGKEGLAFSFAAPSQRHLVRRIEQLMRMRIDGSGEVSKDFAYAERQTAHVAAGGRRPEFRGGYSRSKRPASSNGSGYARSGYSRSNQRSGSTSRTQSSKSRSYGSR
ncbi:MAG: DEAD/DEAH box helicase [bacterium]|nr:DEAD/DEAH box helicase [bacterium]